MRFATKLPLLAALLLALPATAAQVPLSGHVTPRLKGAALLGRAAPDERVDLSLAVKLDQSLLDSTLAQIYAQPPASRHYLSPSEFAQRFGLADKRQKLKSFARASGLTVDASADDPASGVVKVYGPVSAVEQAFGVRLNRYLGPDGRLFRAHDADPVIPAELAPHLAAVVGLSNAAGVFHPHLRLPSLAPGARPALAGTTGALGGLSPADIKKVYGLTSSLDGTGQSIGIVELDGYAPADITSYESTYGLPTLAPTPRSVDAQGNLCGASQNQPCNSATYATDSAGMIEVALDIELAIALAPKAASVLVYIAPNTNQGLLDAFSAIAADGTAKVASNSWGQAESSAGAAQMAAENTVFQRLAAQGQSVYSASGDFGAFDAGGTTTLAVDDPAAQPYVTAVGGTSLSGAVGGAITETVWNTGVVAGNYQGSGGGVSSQWSLPSYQNGVPGLASGANRNLPDVALDADPNAAPYSVVVNGANQLIGGTSAAAPLWAAMTALVNQNRANLGYATPLGFANTAIYQLAQGTAYASAFSDVTSGNNGHYSAQAGYDDATGWGSFKADALATDINSLSSPAAAAFTTVGLSSVTANWSRGGQPAGAVFNAQISTDNFSTVNASSVTANAFALFGTGGAGAALAAATTYYFRVQASSGGQNSAFTSLGAEWTLPAQPQSFSLTTVYTSSITLSWTANGNPAGTVYRVDYWQPIGSTASFFTASTNPTLNGLAEGATYTLTLGALNAGGALTAAALPLSTTTIASPVSAPVVLTSTGGSVTIHPPPGLITLTAPAGALTQNASITLSIPASFPSAPSAAGNLTGTGLGVQVDSGGIEPVRNTTISIGYRANSDIANLDPKELVVARYDPVDNLWVPLPSTVDTVGLTVTGATSHWSLFQVMQNAPASSVSSAKAFPNPWRVSQGPASMTFSQLPAGARIRIYTLTGLIVKDLTADASGMASWDGTNESGRNVASGFYFAFAQGSGGNETLKLAVQR